MTEKKIAPPDPTVVLDLALKLRRGQVKVKDIPKEVWPAVAAVSERDLIKHAVASSGIRRFGHRITPPASRAR